MKHINLRHILPLLSAGLISPMASADAITLGFGLNGLAIEYHKAFSPKLTARVSYSSLDLNVDGLVTDETDEDQNGTNFANEDIEYDIDIERNNIGILLDWRPFGGAFHLTGGVYAGGNEWNLEANRSTGEFDIGDTTYTSNNLSLTASAKFADTAPYFGFGWGNAAEGSAFTANLDIGVLLAGSPNISLDATGVVTNEQGVTLDVLQSAEFQQDLERERADVQKDVEDFEAYPVIQFNLGYRF